MIVAADSALLGDSEVPGHGKRPMAPPPPPPTTTFYKKHLKSCKNPLFRMETEEDTWSISLLTGPHTDPQPEEQNEFNFPPALESSED